MILSVAFILYNNNSVIFTNNFPLSNIPDTMDNLRTPRRTRRTSQTMLYKQRLYREAKAKNINVRWTSSVANMENAIVESKAQSKAIVKLSEFSQRVFKHNDQANIQKINSLVDTENSHELSLGEFHRIADKIHAPANKYILITLKGRDGQVLSEYVRQHRTDMDEQEMLMRKFQESGSDEVEEFDFTDAYTVEVQYVNLPKQNRSSKKEFFRFLTNCDYNLDEFQVYAEFPIDEMSDEYKIANTPCFIHALRSSNVDETIISQIISMMHTSGVSLRFIAQIATKFNLSIALKSYKEYEGRFDSKKINYGPKSNNCIELGIVAQHIFAIKPTNISKDALSHPEFSSHPLFPKIKVKNSGKRIAVMRKNDNVKTLDSFQVISILYFNREKLLRPITLAEAPTLLNGKFADIDNLSEICVSDEFFKPIGRCVSEDLPEGKIRKGRFPFMDKEKNPLPYYNVYFDVETFIPMGESAHKVYMVAYKIDDEPTQYVWGYDCMSKFLNRLPKDSNFLMWAHNAGFDNMFLLNHFSSFSNTIIHNGNNLKQVEGYFYDNRHIIIKDTKAFLNTSLAKMPKMFKGACKGLSLEKESFPHEWINEKNLNGSIPLIWLEPNFKDFENLKANASKIGAIQKNALNVKQYAIHYCMRDVDVLYQCFEAFRKMMIDRFDQDVRNHISIPGLAYDILHEEGCFDDCYSMSGAALSFVRQAIVGGRVMTRDNQKHHIKHDVLDYDAVSLYPSAMRQLNGYLKGKAKFFKGQPPQCDDYIASVRILSLNKERHFPLQSIKDNGSRNFTNDIIGKTLTMGRVALEDLIQFQEVEVEFIHGLYWDEGYNTQIVSTIESLFFERLSLKREGNPLQEGIKLLMNSSYGKLIQKPIVKSRRMIKGADRINTYIRKNITKFISRSCVSKELSVIEEHKALSEFFSPAHLGVQILDMSKRIMNRVMCLAEDIDAKIWYQDTDSMHIDREALPRLETAFHEKYNAVIGGSSLGQFHSDFEIDGVKNQEIWASESIFLGKKSYFDKLISEDGTTGAHIRMKGIPAKIVQAGGFKLYEDLFKGDSKTFNLLECCPLQIDSKKLKVYKRRAFERTIKF